MKKKNIGVAIRIVNTNNSTGDILTYGYQFNPIFIKNLRHMRYFTSLNIILSKRK